jgi:hypothetical protein
MTPASQSPPSPASNASHRIPIRLAVLALAIILGGIRLYGVKSPLFQAIAHLAVGSWFGIWLLGRRLKSDPTDFDIDDYGAEVLVLRDGGRERFYHGYSFYGWVALILSLVELFAFLRGKFL